jgi:uncharacterized protein YkwD
MQGTTRVLASLAVLAAFALAPASGSARARGTMTPATQLRTALLAQINDLRASHGLARLRISAPLASVSTGHSAQMARLGFFSHNSANGQSFSQRVAAVYKPGGFRSWSVGENLVWGAPGLGAARAFRLWLSSPPHRENLLNPRWREVGLGGVRALGAPGVYGGSDVTILTADFGVRR